jgi:hypothetical protein
MSNDADTVRFLDVDTGKVVTIPASELAPGAVRARVEGIDEIVWLIPDGLKQQDAQHPTFTEDIRELLQRIHAAFSEHRPLTLVEWEDGFRRDNNPAQEIAIWLRAADVYVEFVGQESWSEAERQDAYRVVLACTIATPDTIWRVLSISALDRKQAQWIVDRYYGANG